MLRKVNKDPFSNGTELMIFNENNCDKCVKSSHYIEKKDNTVVLFNETFTHV